MRYVTLLILSALCWSGLSAEPEAPNAPKDIAKERMSVIEGAYPGGKWELITLKKSRVYIYAFQYSLRSGGKEPLHWMFTVRDGEKDKVIGERPLTMENYVLLIDELQHNENFVKREQLTPSSSTPGGSRQCDNHNGGVLPPSTGALPKPQCPEHQ